MISRPKLPGPLFPGRRKDSRGFRRSNSNRTTRSSSKFVMDIGPPICDNLNSFLLNRPLLYFARTGTCRFPSALMPEKEDRPHSGGCTACDRTKPAPAAERSDEMISMPSKNTRVRFSLASKVSVLATLLVLATAVGISLFTIRMEVAGNYRDLLNHGLTLADATARSCVFGVSAGSAESLNGVTQGLASDADIVYAAVLRPDGSVIARNVFHAEAEIPEGLYRDLGRVRSARHTNVMGERDGERYLDILYPIVADGRFPSAAGRTERAIGYLRLGMTQQRLHAKIRHLVLSTTLFTTFLVILGSLLSFYLSRRLTAPLARLKAATQDIALGNFDRSIEIGASGEIAELAGAFDHMRHSLRSYRDQIVHDAVHDSLTGLPNRALFSDRLKHAITVAKRKHGWFFGVLVIDLDGFKIVNDSLGPTVGDQLLIECSKRLTACVRPEDTVARLGGDEFAVLLEDISGEGNALYVASRVKTVLQDPFAVAGHEVFITGSIGIALSSGGYEFPEQVLRDADTAMYQTKARSRSNFTVFEPAMHAHAVERLLLETDLRRALDRREFVTYYQPIVSVGSRDIVGYEALARWLHPERGLIPPAGFLSLAEETGLIVAVERQILRQACEQMRSWLDRFGANGLRFVSVNLAHRQIRQPDLVDYVDRTLRETGLQPEHLKLEITENVLFENPEAAANLLKRLRDLGVELYIDDFGTGYSSLSYLHRLPINGLKIDRSFIKRIDEAGENKAIVRTIMTLARDMRIDVVAEGVETAGQLSHVESLNCAYWQGYLFSRPVQSADAQALLAG